MANLRETERKRDASISIDSGEKITCFRILLEKNADARTNAVCGVSPNRTKRNRERLSTKAQPASSCKPKEKIEEGKRIWILSLPGEDMSNYSLPPEELINHPLSRGGTVVRQESNNRSGIQFDPETNENQPQYQRWYRGKSKVVVSSRCWIESEPLSISVVR